MRVVGSLRGAIPLREMLAWEMMRYALCSGYDVVIRQHLRAIARSGAGGHYRPGISEQHSRVCHTKRSRWYISRCRPLRQILAELSVSKGPKKSDARIPTITMVAIYCGKITHAHHAQSTIITVVAPEGIRDGRPCLIYWQWAVTGAGEANRNMEFTGQFTEMVYPSVECRESSDSYYWFTWNLRTNTMLLMNKLGQRCGEPIMLEKVYPVGICESGYWLTVADSARDAV